MTRDDTRPVATLPADHAFVVQLRKGTAVTFEGVSGEAEHIVSGESAAFHSLEELRVFLARVLARQAEEHPP